jgi:hypothetical protein
MTSSEDEDYEGWYKRRNVLSKESSRPGISREGYSLELLCIIGIRLLAGRLKIHMRNACRRRKRNGAPHLATDLVWTLSHPQ